MKGKGKGKGKELRVKSKNGSCVLGTILKRLRRKDKGKREKKNTEDTEKNTESTDRLFFKRKRQFPFLRASPFSWKVR